MYGVDSVKKSSSMCEEYGVRRLDTLQEGGRVVFGRQRQYDLGTDKKECLGYHYHPTGRKCDMLA